MNELLNSTVGTADSGGMTVVEKKKPIGVEEIRKAADTMQKYKEGKAALENRIVENEKWWRLRHWDTVSPSNNESDPEPVSAWLHNSINNKHADFMDNYPTPNILPREESDSRTAEALSEIIPVILEINDFETTYSKCSYQKLQYGTACYGVFWDSSKNNGLGDVDISKIDLLNLFWQPGVDDIQKSRNLFSVTLVDTDLLEQQYPELKGKLAGGESTNIKKYSYDDTVDTSEKSIVVDWYYKQYRNGREVLQLCKFVDEQLLFASENEPEKYPDGFYGHGQYPFVFDVMFPVEGSPAGFGYIDVGKSPQIYIDKLNQIIIKNALMSGRKRYLVSNSCKINEEEFADWSNDIIHTTAGNLDDTGIRELDTNPLPAVVYNVMQGKIDEIKETTGNRDFSQGGTSSGVTAASAIAALQEAGNKLARDMIKASYRAHTKVCSLVLELIREFYDEPRCFRITNDEGYRFATFDNSGMLPQAQGGDFGLDLPNREPVFDIKINSQKSSPFNRLSQNENAKEMYNLGFFNPDMANQALIALSMMDFEGKDAVVKKVQEQNALVQQMQQLQQTCLQLAAVVDALKGSNISQGIVQQLQGEGTQAIPSGGMAGGMTVDSLGNAYAENGYLARARERAEGNTEPGQGG